VSGVNFSRLGTAIIPWPRVRCERCGGEHLAAPAKMPPGDWLWLVRCGEDTLYVPYDVVPQEAHDALADAAHKGPSPLAGPHPGCLP